MDPAKFQDIITCGICSETFDDSFKCPRILSCGHSFCHSCLENLLVQSPSCPSCKTGIKFHKAESIPINVSLKNLINFTCQVSKENTFETIDLEGGTCTPANVGPIPATNAVKYMSEGHCDEHDTYKGMRCMDCEVWICGICSTLHHKHCRTLLVAEAHKELRKHKYVFRIIDKELGEHRTVQKRLTESLSVLDAERKTLIAELKRKELDLKNREERIKELEFVKSEEVQFCDKLNQLKTMLENITNEEEFSNSVREVDDLLATAKKHVLDGLPHIFLPQTRNALETLCQNGPVYVVEDRYGGTRYGKVAVKDGRIWVYSTEPEKPDACIFNFHELLLRFHGSTELPKAAFFELTPEDGWDDDFEVIIETDGRSAKAKHFIQMCSSIDDCSYKGLTMECTFNFIGDPILYGGATGDHAFESHGNETWFRIQLKDCGIVF